MPGKEPGHAIRSECLSDQPVVQTGQPRLHNVRVHLEAGQAGFDLELSVVTANLTGNIRGPGGLPIKAAGPASDPPRPQGFGRQPSRLRREDWWSRSGSNRRPQACKARALPTELRPRIGNTAGLPTEAANPANRLLRQGSGGQPSRLRRECWWARDELNVRPHAYQACALTT